MIFPVVPLNRAIALSVDDAGPMTPVESKVSVFVVASGVIVIPVPAVKVNLSGPTAAITVAPDWTSVKALLIPEEPPLLCAVLVIVVPEIEIPEPAVRVTAPVAP